MTPADVCATAREAIGEKVVATSVLGGGRNSRVFEATTPFRKVVVKYYYRNPADPRDRQLTEYNALTFLRDKGIACVPEVLHLDREQGFTLLSFIEGERIVDAQMTESDARGVIAFAAQLKVASKDPGAHELAAASEAFFTLDDIVENISKRLDRLHGRPIGEPMEAELNEFLRDRFVPAFEELSSRAKVYYRRCGLEADSVLPEAKRVLSPSDFGLHNCIKSSEGLVFLDLEYFGWDDPVKMVSDFLLHPAQGQIGIERYRAARGMISLFGDQREMRDRLKALLPLFGLKWCMIVLNEFLAGENARRVFSGSDEDYESVLRRQLNLAETMLGQAVGGDIVARLVEQN